MNMKYNTVSQYYSGGLCIWYLGLQWGLNCVEIHLSYIMLVSLSITLRR